MVKSARVYLCKPGCLYFQGGCENMTKDPRWKLLTSQKIFEEEKELSSNLSSDACCDLCGRPFSNSEVILVSRKLHGAYEYWEGWFHLCKEPDPCLYRNAVRA